MMLRCVKIYAKPICGILVTAGKGTSHTHMLTGSDCGFHFKKL